MCIGVSTDHFSGGLSLARATDPAWLGHQGKVNVEDALHGAGHGVMAEKCFGLRGVEE